MPEETIADEGRYRRFRHYTPSAEKKYISPYEWEGAEIQMLQQNAVDVLFSQILDLTLAQTFGQPLSFTTPGRALVLYGITATGGASNPYDPTTNTGIEPVASTAFVFCRINSKREDEGFALKHNRGFRGPFGQFHLSWPAQANVKARLVVYKCSWVPWQNGEAAT